MVIIQDNIKKILIIKTFLIIFYKNINFYIFKLIKIKYNNLANVKKGMVGNANF